MTKPIVLLILFAVVLAWFIYTDGSEYRRFKTFTESRARQRVYASWLVKSFLAFGGGAVLSLFWLGEQSALWAFPPAFAPLLKPARDSLQNGQGMKEFLFGAASSAVVGLIVMTLLLRVLRKRSGEKPKQVVIGDIQPLLPRNGAERVWAAVLSLNAGLSEELFFRLALPLVLVLIFGNALIAFIIATVVFGFMHLYQGVPGVIATTIVGAVMSAIYLATGDIWIVIVLHAAIDLNGLLLMPYLAGRKAAAQ
jgi:uncharacterized protein